MRELPVLSGEAVADVATSWPIQQHLVRGRGRLNAFVSDTVATPDGGTMVRDYLTHTGAVGIIALDEHERVVVVRQYRHPVGFKLVEPPAGLLDAEGEAWLVAAQRELAEEVGVAATDWSVLVDFMSSPGCLQESLRVFLARGLSEAPRPDGFVLEGEEADMEVCLVPLEDLVAAIFAGRVQNPTLVVGVLAAHTALRTGRLTELRTPDSPWPARDAKAVRDAELAQLEAL